MSSAFIFTPTAVRDVGDILDYGFEQSGSDAAFRVHKRLFQRFAKIGSAPGIGHRRDDLVDEAARVCVVFS